MKEYLTEQPIVSILLSLILFLILREVLCWYYKINIMVKQQQETNELLRTLVNLNSNNSTPKTNDDNNPSNIDNPDYINNHKDGINKNNSDI